MLSARIVALFLHEKFYNNAISSMNSKFQNAIGVAAIRPTLCN